MDKPVTIEKEYKDMKLQATRLLAHAVEDFRVLSDAHPISRFVESMMSAAIYAARIDRADQELGVTADASQIAINLETLIKREIPAVTGDPSSWTLPTTKGGDFFALIQYDVRDTVVPVYYINLPPSGDGMVIALPEGPVYINKVQAMAFFDLEEKGTQKPASNEVPGGWDALQKLVEACMGTPYNEKINRAMSDAAEALTNADYRGLR